MCFTLLTFLSAHSAGHMSSLTKTVHGSQQRLYTNDPNIMLAIEKLNLNNLEDLDTSAVTGLLLMNSDREGE